MFLNAYHLSIIINDKFLRDLLCIRFRRLLFRCPLACFRTALTVSNLLVDQDHDPAWSDCRPLSFIPDAKATTVLLDPPTGAAATGSG
jgi:hypothetical protein